MNSQFRLNLEAARENGKRFHETARERPIARENIGERTSEHVGDKAGEQPVADAMAEAIGRLLAIDTDGNDHVEPVLDKLADHRRRTRRVIGRIAVNQHVDVRFDIIEHPSHHVAFALMALAADDSACLPGNFDRAVGRVIVVDVHPGPQAMPSESRPRPWQ